MRWSGPFLTPNVAGLEISLALCGILVLGSLFLNRYQSKSASVLLYICATIPLYYLAATGSRAAIISFGVALIFLAITKTISKNIAVSMFLLVVLLICFSQNIDRFSPINQSSHPEARLPLWRGSLALIADHPLFGLGKDNAIPILDRWYLPYDLHGRFGTALNDSLTTAVFWGIPLTAIYVMLVVLLLSIGAKQSFSGSKIAALGTCMIAINFICGQFQGYLYAEWWNIYLGWILGILLVLTHSFKEFSTRLAIKCIIAGLAFCVILYFTSMVVGDSQWKTIIVENEIIAIPKNGESTGLIVVLNSKSAPDFALGNWCADKQSKKISLSFIESIPDAAWWQSIERLNCCASKPPIAIAYGEAATALWNAKNSGITQNAQVILYDPIGVPKSILASPGKLTVHIARSAPFVSHEIINQYAQQNSATNLVIEPGTVASWWKPNHLEFNH